MESTKYWYFQPSPFFPVCALAQTRGTTINRLLDEMTTLMLAEFDAETRFKLGAARGAGRSQIGLALLDKAAQRGTPQPT